MGFGSKFFKPFKKFPADFTISGDDHFEATVETFQGTVRKRFGLYRFVEGVVGDRAFRGDFKRSFDGCRIDRDALDIRAIELFEKKAIVDPRAQRRAC